jgi:Mg2+/Co2+ transporter CorC
MSDETKVQVKQYRETDIELGKISCVYNPKDFCERLVSAVNIATTYRNDVDQWESERKVSSVITNDRHSKFTAEELARKWNIGIQTAKDTIQVTTQRGIRTAIHPMMRRLRVDHLNLH